VSEPAVVKVRSGMGETVRAEFLGLEDGRARVRFLKKVQGRQPESLIHPKRIIGGVPTTGIEVDRGPK
jgi:hypothetical protein